MESAGVVRRGHKQKANVLSKRPGGKNVQAGKVKTMGDQPAFVRGAGSRVRDVRVVHAFAMPVRSNTEGDRPIRGVLVDGGIAFISHLISVVLELLPKRAEPRPNFVARGAGHAVLACERRYSADASCRARKSGSRTERQRKEKPAIHSNECNDSMLLQCQDLLQHSASSA